MRVRRWLALGAALITVACTDHGVRTLSAEQTEAPDPTVAGPPATDPPVTDPPASDPPVTTAEPPPDSGAGDPLYPELGSAELDVQHYDVRLDYDPATEEIDATVTIATATRGPVDEIVLDADELTVESVEVDGAPAPFEHRDGDLTIDLGETRGPVPAEDPLEVTVTYRDRAGAVPPSGGMSPEGWFATDEGSFVLNEPDGAHTWLPSNDHPSDKATWRFELTVPDGTAAIANGHLVEQRDDGGQDTWVWEQREPMATYLVQLLTGDYVVVDGGMAGDTPLVNVTLAGTEEDLQPYFDLTDDQIAFFEPLFGPYPLDQYGLAFTESFQGLAMETQGRSLFSHRDFAGQEPGELQHILLAHEVAHQWFGNAVTPSSWSDLWLNESFATYAQWLWLDHTGQWDLESQADLSLRLRQRPTEPTGTPTLNNLFGFERYDGGAVVLHALRGELGDDTFFDLLQRWVAENDGTSRSTADFIALSEEIAGRSLDAFFDAWLFAPSVPPEYP